MNMLSEAASAFQKIPDVKVNFVHNQDCKVICRQQPLHGKAVGFKQQYGNFIDPILILELKIAPGNKKINLKSLNYVCVVELVDHYTKIQRSTVIVEDKIQIDKYSGDLKAIPHRYQINLRGTKTNCGEVFRDPDTGIESKFFVFNDLAVRTMGKYRLRASIFNLDRPDSNGLTLYTKPFEVQSARNYGARIGPTKLMQALAVQGNLAIGRKHRNAKRADGDAAKLLANLESSDGSSSPEDDDSISE